MRRRRARVWRRCFHPRSLPATTRGAVPSGNFLLSEPVLWARRAARRPPDPLAGGPGGRGWTGGGPPGGDGPRQDTPGSGVLPATGPQAPRPRRLLARQPGAGRRQPAPEPRARRLQPRRGHALPVVGSAACAPYRPQPTDDGFASLARRRELGSPTGAVPPRTAQPPEAAAVGQGRRC